MTAAEPRDRYQPETRLEAGLGGERWLATDRQTGKVVWLGVLDARAATAAHRSAFEAWVRIAPTLVHPSLERLLDSGQTALGNPFFAVECIEAETLALRFDREPAMSVHELVRVVTAVVDGLLVAHRAGLTHGDIAPDRVFLLAGGRARLAGFGMNRAVARSQDAAREANTLPYGDAYMSPEQAAGGAATPSDDVWSVAAILYRGVTGIAPRAHLDGRSTIAGIVGEPTRAVAELRPDLPNSFVQLLEKALAADPPARFRDAAELRKALTSALILAPAVARLPVIASPVSHESGEGLGKNAPALPPPPTRARTGIGPLGRARGAELEASALATLAPRGPATAQDASRLSDAPPSLVPRESHVPSRPPAPSRALQTPPPKPAAATKPITFTPAPTTAPDSDDVPDSDDSDDSGEFLELDDASEIDDVDDLDDATSSGAPDADGEDDDGVMTSATTKVARPPAPLAERSPHTGAGPGARRSEPPTTPPTATPPSPPSVPHASATDGTDATDAPDTTSGEPSGAPEPVAGRPAARVPWSMPEPAKRWRIPRRGWAAIALLAVGSFVAMSGGTRWLATYSSRAEVAEGERASEARRANTNAATSSQLTTPRGSTAIVSPTAPSGRDAGAGVARDAGMIEPPPPAPVEPVPVVPPVEPPVEPPRDTPRVRPPRTGTTSTSTGTTRVTPPAMVTAPADPPRMTSAPAMTDSTMHALERDPGF